MNLLKATKNSCLGILNQTTIDRTCQVCGLVDAYFYSGGEWEIWQKIKKTVSDNDLSSISEMKYKLNLLEKRINGIKLIAKDAGTQDYGCGQARKADSNTLKVMSGLRDGTGCQIGNLNYYKELILIVPE